MKLAKLLAIIYLAFFSSFIHAKLNAQATFSYGIAGTYTNNAHQPQGIVPLSDLDITHVKLIASSDDGTFGGTQGNDTAVIAEFFFSNSPSVTVDGAINWRQSDNGQTNSIGIILDNDATVMFGSVNYFNPPTTYLLRLSSSTKEYTNDNSAKGNAAKGALSSVMNDLNLEAAAQGTSGGSVSAAFSDVTVSQTSVLADGNDSSTIALQLKNGNDGVLPLTGQNVTFTSTIGAIGPVSDEGNGRYVAVISSSTAGMASIFAFVDGTEMNARATVEFIAQQVATYSISGAVVRGQSNVGVEGVDVYLFAATDTQFSSPLATQTTASDGTYTFENLTNGDYSVQFASSNGRKFKAQSKKGNRGASPNSSSKRVNTVESITINGENITEVDAILIDPAGVVYDSSSRLPIAGATVKFNYSDNGSVTLVPDAWLDLTAGGANTQITQADGFYSFVLNGNAPQVPTIYSIDVTPPNGYTFESSVIPATSGPYDSGLGGGLVAIQPQVTAPSVNDDTTYYLTFELVIGDTLVTSSNGVINNHIPIDAYINQPPVADDNSIVVDFNTAKTITLTGSDAESDVLSFEIVSQPSNGTLSGSGATRTYTPDANYSGSDSFTFRAIDLTGSNTYSQPAQVDIEVSGTSNIIASAQFTCGVVGEYQTGSPAHSPEAIQTLASLSIDKVILAPLTDNGVFGGTQGNDYAVAAEVFFLDGNSVSFNGAVNWREGNTNAIGIITDEFVSDGFVLSPGFSKTYLLCLDSADPNDVDYVVPNDVKGNAANNSTLVAANTQAESQGTAGGEIDISSTQVSTSADTALADGIDSIVITVSIHDATGKPLNAFGQQVTIDSSLGVLTSITDNGDGTYSAILTSTVAGLATLTVHVNNTLVTDSETVTFNGLPTNTAPVAIAQSVSTAEDTPKAITLSGSDIDNDNLSYVVVSQPSNGTLSGSGATRTYMPNTNFTGTDSFTFKVNDGTVDSIPATVTITVTNANDAPVAITQSVSTAEDTPKAITLSGSDIDNDTLSYVVVTQPSNGSISGSGATRTYTPNANFTGTDSFTFNVNDGTVDSIPATVTITVTNANDAPVAITQSVSTVEDTSKAITLSGSDIDNDNLSYAVVSQPSNGSLSGSGATRTYTPSADFTGTDSFTFKVNDGTVDSIPATVTITVTNANDAPVAMAQSVSTAEDTSKTITLSGSDIDNDNLSYVVVSQPSNGSLSGSGATRTYTPNADFTGTDTFTFKVNDGSEDSATATVTIRVSNVNDAPVAQGQSVTTPEDTAKTITLSGSDADNDTLTYVVVTQPSNGTLSGSGATRTYTPNADFTGTDTFTYKVNDGSEDSATATVTIRVSNVNDAPVAQGQSVTTPEDTAKTITLSGSDADNDTLNYVVVTQPSNGTLSGSGATRTYTPNADFTGSDTFTFKVNDGSEDSATATVTITVSDVNDAPVAQGQSVTTPEDTAKVITLAGSDADNDTLSYVVVTQPSNGTLSGSGATRTYTPNADFTGSDTFTYKVNDGSEDSSTATVTITVSDVNDAPVAQDQSVTTPEDTAKVITLSGSDADNDTLSYVVVTQPSNGTLSGSGATRTYTPNADFTGTDTFTYKVNDGSEDSVTATVTITVSDVNDAPVAQGQSVTTPEDTAKTITLSGSDADNDTLSYVVVTQPSNGTLSGSGATRTYTPNADFTGSDTFTYKLNDGSEDSAIVTVTIRVSNVNDAPVAQGQSVTTPEDTAKTITFSGSDIDNDTLSYVVVTQPSNGTLSGNGATRTYTPNADFTGSDTFTYKVNDGSEDSSTATVTITVSNVNDAPVAQDQSVTTPEDTAKTITLTGSDADNDTLSYVVVTQPSNGTLSGSGATRTYTPNADFTGTDTFMYKVNDGSEDSATATVTITVSDVNDAPVAQDQSVTTPEDTAKVITLSGSDADNDTLSYVVVTQPSNGTLSGSGATRTYTPNADFTGTDTFTYKVNDGSEDSATVTVTITVSDVNDAPVAQDQSVTTPEDTAKTITLSGIDADNDTLSYVVVTQPSNGKLSGSGATRTYTPNADFTGSDTFTYKVNDGSDDSATVTVTITVSDVNDAPVAQDQSVTTPEDTAKTITLSGIDA
ncbi:Ig-like domain-containing protein, partial [Alteromonas hispanica]